MPTTYRASGALFGMAFGDALGAYTEFLTVEEILQRFPPNGPVEPAGYPALVTDDTQMALAVGEALLAATHPLTAASLEPPLRRAFLEWYHSPDNNRAPGNTCLRACAGLERGLPWLQATIAASKGCGANMRVAPVGLLPPTLTGGDAGGTNPTPAGWETGGTPPALFSTVADAIAPEATPYAVIAQFQAALTHGHPTGLAAADLTAMTVQYLARGGSPNELPHWLRNYAHSQRMVYHADWLGTLWQRPGVETPLAFIARGWDECLAVLDRLDAALARPDRASDPCLATGAGWVAEEAFATGLLCFLLFPDYPVAAIRRAAVSSGDSDSIACLTGAFAGAAHGLAAWPQAWVERIEYRERLERLGNAWDGGFANG